MVKVSVFYLVICLTCVWICGPVFGAEKNDSPLLDTNLITVDHGIGEEQGPDLIPSVQILRNDSNYKNVNVVAENTSEKPPIRAASISDTIRVSVNSTGIEGNGDSDSCSISEDGMLIAYASLAKNLVMNDTNTKSDIFLHNRYTGSTSRLSVSSSGIQGNGGSYYPSISNDGKYVAFYSAATNLVPGDTNGDNDIFVRDVQNGTTIRVSVSSDGTQGNRDSDDPSISGDGRYIAFTSGSTNLVVGDTNGFSDVFVFDRMTGTCSRVSLTSNGNEGNRYSGHPSISEDGRYVAFDSQANELGGFDDTDTNFHIYIRDRKTGKTVCADLSVGGERSSARNPSISADGDVAFQVRQTYHFENSGAPYGVEEIYLYDNKYGRLKSMITNGYYPDHGHIGSKNPSISSDGRYVVFSTDIPRYGAGDQGDIVLYDVYYPSSSYNICSVSSGGILGNLGSREPSISSNGRSVAFESSSSNLVSGDNNSDPDIFVHDFFKIDPPAITNVSPNSSLNTNSICNTSLTGSRFLKDSTVKLTMSGQTNIVGTNILVSPPTNITCSFPVGGKKAGAWDLFVTAGVQSTTLVGGFYIRNPRTRCDWNYTPICTEYWIGKYHEYCLERTSWPVLR